VRCSGCSLVFVREKVSEETLAAYYAAAEADQVYCDPANEANLQFYDRRLQTEIERRCPRGRLLDVGCDRGRFLDVMEGWDRHGIELSPALASLARESYGDRIHTGTLFDFDNRGMLFDVVTLFDALDHMPDPGLAIERCRSLLKAGGLLVVKVHNIDCLYARWTGPRFYAISPPGHLFYFSPRTLRRLVEARGFAESESRFFSHRLALKNVFYRLAKGSPGHPAFRVYRWLEKTSLGRATIRKNLHDIVTLFARKA
jgi:2-polyprenyl-3-methyl-5-hydroxy-6-metoxy-1,4-benzoquinol methylase